MIMMMKEKAMSKTANRLESERLVREYITRGGTITIGRAARKTKANSSWTGIRCDVAYRGRKAHNLRATGYAKAA